jgi:RNA 3'-terminal phosphate cyclase (ATP)
VLTGLKAQHVSSIQYLARATAAEVTGCTIGSQSIEFRPTLSPADLINRNIKIKAESAGSLLLVFQALLPFLLFAGDDSGSSITITIQGGTNVSFSLSFEYLDQVLLPALERFGVTVDRRLESRGWSLGTSQLGSVRFQIVPLPVGQTLKAPAWPTERGTITEIAISIIVPEYAIKAIKNSLLLRINLVFPGAETYYHLVEDSRHKARFYTLLVAHTSSGLKFGRDWLYNRTTKNKTPEELGTEIAQKVVDDLDTELEKGGLVDEYLQDQLVVFQALAAGSSSIPGTSAALSSDRVRVDRTDEPFGDGSTHTTTARWVASQLLPHAKWIDNGRLCEGVGWKASPTTFMN